MQYYQNMRADAFQRYKEQYTALQGTVSATCLMSALSNQGTFASAYRFLGAISGKEKSYKTSLFTPHSSDLTPHIAYLVPRIAHLTHLTPHSSLLKLHTLHLTSHSSYLTPHTSHLMPGTTHFAPRASDFQTSHLRPQMSHLTLHISHRASHTSRGGPRIQTLHPSLLLYPSGRENQDANFTS